MIYTIDGIIKLITKLRLNSAVDFISPSEAHITLKSKSDEDLSVSITLEAENETDAEKLAQIELTRICNLLSFLHNIAVLRTRITGMTYERVTSEGNRVITASATVNVSTRFSVVLGLGEKSLEKLVCDMKQKYSPEFEEAVSMWREAISNETPTLKYLLLYRLMEFLFSSDTKKLTDWIVSKEPSVRIVNDRKRGDVTIYTHLRDNIHPKQKRFPTEDIHKFLPGLQTLVKRAIEEKFGYNHI